VLAFFGKKRNRPLSPPVLLNINVIVDHCVAVCCSVLQCVAVCCNVLQCVAVFHWIKTIGHLLLGFAEFESWWGINAARHYSTLQHTATHCNAPQQSFAENENEWWRMPKLSALQCVKVWCGVLQCVAHHLDGGVLKDFCVAVCCSVLQCVAICKILPSVVFHTWADDLIVVHFKKLCQRVLQLVAVCCSTL